MLCLVFGTSPAATGSSEPSPRDEGVIYRVFGTEPPPTTISEPSPRGKGDIYRHFDTATLPKSISVASSRSYCELVYRIVAELSFVKFTWHEPLLIIK